MDKAKIYCTTYCNKGHRVSDGKPVGHECRVIPPAALEAEMAGDYWKAASLIEERPAVVMRRGVRG